MHGQGFGIVKITYPAFCFIASFGDKTTCVLPDIKVSLDLYKTTLEQVTQELISKQLISPKYPAFRLTKAGVKYVLDHKHILNKSSFSGNSTVVD